jgi:hypothetical protein
VPGLQAPTCSTPGSIPGPAWLRSVQHSAPGAAAALSPRARRPLLQAGAGGEEGGEGGEEVDKRRAVYDIMCCMRDIRKRTERTDGMFEPLKDAVALLQVGALPWRACAGVGWRARGVWVCGCVLAAGGRLSSRGLPG